MSWTLYIVHFAISSTDVRRLHEAHAMQELAKYTIGGGSHREHKDGSSPWRQERSPGSATASVPFPTNHEAGATLSQKLDHVLDVVLDDCASSGTSLHGSPNRGDPVASCAESPRTTAGSRSPYVKLPLLVSLLEGNDLSTYAHLPSA